MRGRKIEVPKQSKGDVAHTLTKAGLSVIPVVGGPAVELFQLLIQPPLGGKARLEARGERLGGEAWGQTFIFQLTSNEK